MVIMVGVLTPVLIFARPLMQVFTDEPGVIKIGMAYLYIEAITFCSYVILHQSNSVLQGTKKPAMIMWVGLYRQVPASLALFPLFTVVLGLAVNGVWWGLAVVNWSAALFVLFFAPGCCGTECLILQSCHRNQCPIRSNRHGFLERWRR